MTKFSKKIKVTLSLHEHGEPLPEKCKHCGPKEGIFRYGFIHENMSEILGEGDYKAKVAYLFGEGEEMCDQCGQLQWAFEYFPQNN